MQPTASSEIKIHSILHFAMFLGQLLFGIITFYLVYSKRFLSPLYTEYAKIIIPFCLELGTLAYLSGTIFFKRKIDQINSHYKPLPQKFNEYRGASIVRWALLEFAEIFCVIFFMLTNNYLLITITGSLFFLFISCRPTMKKITSDLEISDNKSGKLASEDFFINSNRLSIFNDDLE
jgi:hypothetical protein